MESAAAGQGHERGADLCLCLREYSNSGTGSSQGHTKAGVGVESINCEFTEADEIQAAVENVMDLSSALPRLRACLTQVQTALGIVPPLLLKQVSRRVWFWLEWRSG